MTGTVAVGGTAGRSDRGLLVAIDVGTSGARAAIFDLDGRRLLEARRAYPTRSPRVGWAEQDARAWRSAAVGALADVVRRLVTPTGSVGPGDIRAIGLTGQCPSVVLVDARSEPVRPGAHLPRQPRDRRGARRSASGSATSRSIAGPGTCRAASTSSRSSSGSASTSRRPSPGPAGPSSRAISWRRP